MKLNKRGQELMSKVPPYVNTRGGRREKRSEHALSRGRKAVIDARFLAG